MLVYPHTPYRHQIWRVAHEQLICSIRKGPSSAKKKRTSVLSRLPCTPIVRLIGHSTPSAGCRSLLRRGARSSRFVAGGGRSRSSRLCRNGLLALAKGLSRGCVPVVKHLRCKHAIQHEARHEAVQNQLVVNLLEGRENPSGGAEKIVENLPYVEISLVGSRDQNWKSQEDGRLIVSQGHLAPG